MLMNEARISVYVCVCILLRDFVVVTDIVCRIFGLKRNVDRFSDDTRQHLATAIVS